MGKKIRIKTKRGWIGYPGSTVQQNYAEDTVHGYLLWEISDKDSFDVRFCELPNPKPFVTLPWQGDVSSTIKFARETYPVGCRYRIYNPEPLPQKDVVGLTTGMRDELAATEVTFKTDRHVSRDIITAGGTTVFKDDLRNPGVILKLVKEYHKGAVVSDDEWAEVGVLIEGYLQLVGTEEIVRNTKWTLKHLKFDNTFAYGDGNIINFEALNGTIGIFGPNRIGKSSIVGTIMYALFNGTDRGSIKNLHVINSRRPYCYSRAIVGVNGTDYVIERQTVKNETKRNQVFASTALNVFRLEDGEAVDLAGEQRNDTEKVIRGLIGSPDDFLLTSLSAQDDLKQFITQGTTKRRQILARFLDLDIFDKMYDLAKNDVNSTKAELRHLPDRDWKQLTEQHQAQIVACTQKISDLDERLAESQDRSDVLRRTLAEHKDFTPVTRSQVDAQRARVATLARQVDELSTSIERDKKELQTLRLKATKIVEVQNDNNLDELKHRLEAFRTLEASVNALRHAHEKEVTVQKHQDRSLKILDDVPCGDQFPTCKFIKDAHIVKGKVEAQREKVDKVTERLRKADDALGVLRLENLLDKVTKVEQLNTMLSRLQVDASLKELDLVRQENSRESLIASLDPARSRLEELEEALKNDANAEVVALRGEIDALQAATKRFDAAKLMAATERGRIQTLIDKHDAERLDREATLQRMRAYELVWSAFSRRGIPSIITRSQLPVINAEIAKILHGIVDYTVEFEPEDDSDSMEIYINYGDSRRIIELGSGMEKMIASVALRVALINISSLPKTDMFLLDEGFGALDDASVEACNRLLGALKRYFKTVIVITHVDGVKDAADTVIEVTKNEKDARVTYL